MFKRLSRSDPWFSGVIWQVVNEFSHEILLANIGPTKDKHGVRESFAKVNFSFAKHGRSRIKKFWSPANYLSPMPSTIFKSGLLGSFLGLGWWGHPTNAYWEGLFLGVPHEPWWKKNSWKFVYNVYVLFYWIIEKYFRLSLELHFQAPDASIYIDWFLKCSMAWRLAWV